MSSRGSSSRKKESSGAGAARNAARVAAGGKARGRPAQSKATASESIHERSARLQREGNLPREVQPDHAVLRQYVSGDVDPYASGGSRLQDLRTAYGDDQLGAAMLQHMSMEKMREAFRETRTPGKMPSSKAAMVSAITAHVTRGRYSADFGAKTAGGSKKSGGGSKTATGPATRDSLVARAASLGSQIGRAHRAGDTARRDRLMDDLEAVIKQYRALGAGG